MDILKSIKRSLYNIYNLVKILFDANKISDDIDHDTYSVNISRRDCFQSHCNSWCKECVPRCIVEGWTSENNDVDEFIKDTIYNANDIYTFLEWVPFDRFENIKQIGEGGFAKVYSATWIDGKSYYYKQDDGSWKKKLFNPNMVVALKRLNESNNISKEYLNEVQYVYQIMIIVNFYLIFNGADLAYPFLATSFL